MENKIVGQEEESQYQTITPIKIGSVRPTLKNIQIKKHICQSLGDMHIGQTDADRREAPENVTKL